MLFLSCNKPCTLFPSPYGVSFILIYYFTNFLYLVFIKVSVSLWSIIHSYQYILLFLFSFYYRFRLLMEYHSFLYNDTFFNIEIDGYEFPSPYGVSFILIIICILKSGYIYRVSVSLWSIIHSYYFSSDNNDDFIWFPSPYGVSFILIKKCYSIKNQ